MHNNKHCQCFSRCSISVVAKDSCVGLFHTACIAVWIRCHRTQKYCAQLSNVFAFQLVLLSAVFASVLSSLATADAASLLAMPAHALVVRPALHAVCNAAIAANTFLLSPAFGTWELATIATRTRLVWPTACAGHIAAACATQRAGAMTMNTCRLRHDKTLSSSVASTDTVNVCKHCVRVNKSSRAGASGAAQSDWRGCTTFTNACYCYLARRNTNMYKRNCTRLFCIHLPR
jgi:hypothetical protein